MAVYAVQIISVQLLRFLLHLELQLLQAADVHPGRCILQLLHPLLIDGILLAVSDVVVYVPAEFLQFLIVQELPRFCHGHSVICHQPSIPCFNLPSYLRFRPAHLPLHFSNQPFG